MKESVASLLDDADIDGVQIDYSSTIATSIDGIVGPGEVVGVVIAAIVLLVMLRALLPAVAPLITSLVGVGVGVAGSMAFSGVVDMASITPVLGVMLGLAVGIDYALFILNRHRRQLLAGVELSESIGLANGTSGNAVVFAGTTVIVALLALNVTGIPFLGVMGTVGAVCVAVAVLVAVTLTPALLGLMKLRVLGRRARARIGHPDHAATTPAPMRTWRAVGQAAIAIVALLVIAIPALSMRLGLPDGSSEATDTTQYRANTIITEKFGAGVNGALLVVAEFPSAVAEDDQTSTQGGIVTTLMDQSGVVAVAPVAVSDDGSLFAFQVVPEEGPSSRSTEQLVHELLRLLPASRRRAARSRRHGIRQHRRVAEARGRAADLPAGRGGPVAGDHDRGVPLDPRAGHLDPRVRALAVRGARRGDRDLPVGLALRPCSGFTTPARC